MKLARVRLSSRERLGLFDNIHTMLDSGIPLLDAVESLQRDAKGNTRLVLGELSRALNNGETLGKAISRFPTAFDDVTINLLKSAESGGTLDETLADIVKNTEKEIAFANQIKAAMVYPIFVMILFVVIVIMLLTFVIPRMANVFTTMKVTIPPITTALINVSNFFMDHWFLVALAALAIVALVGTLFVLYKRAIVRWLLGLPGLRRLGLNIDLTRLTRSLALLLKSGVPLDEAVILAKRTVQRHEIMAVVDKMQQNINSGRPLSTGLREQQLATPAMMAQSLETAETSGTLEQTMQNLSAHFDNQISESLRSISSLLEPIMIVVVGLLIGGLMLAVMIPMYNMISQFKAGGQ